MERWSDEERRDLEVFRPGGTCTLKDEFSMMEMQTGMVYKHRWLGVIAVGVCMICLIYITVRHTDGRPLERPYENHEITERILESLPLEWNLHETKKSELPDGHHWACEHKGHGGELLVLSGPQLVPVDWRDENGMSHKDVVATEALNVWVMPESYSDCWRNRLGLHSPISASLIFAGSDIRVYGMPGHLITQAKLFEEILAQAAWVYMADSPHNSKELSWNSWSEDIAGQIARNEI